LFEVCPLPDGGTDAESGSKGVEVLLFLVAISEFSQTLVEDEVRSVSPSVGAIPSGRAVYEPAARGRDALRVDLQQSLVLALYHHPLAE
jgi:hypothetical protein